MTIKLPENVSSVGALSNNGRVNLIVG